MYCISFYFERQPLAFDDVLDEFTSQEQIYSRCAKPLLKGVFNGESAAILCYGQTGSGKTHTM